MERSIYYRILAQIGPLHCGLVFLKEVSLVISSFESSLTEVKGWCEVLPDMQELVVEDLEQDTNDVAAEDEENKISHRTAVVDW